MKRDWFHDATKESLRLSDFFISLQKGKQHIETFRFSLRFRLFALDRCVRTERFVFKRERDKLKPCEKCGHVAYPD